jgi:hypothetical protein
MRGATHSSLPAEVPPENKYIYMYACTYRCLYLYMAHKRLTHTVVWVSGTHTTTLRAHRCAGITLSVDSGVAWRRKLVDWTAIATIHR